jgi:energy-coupling factor transporter transmembrane protein EcfT
MDAGWKVVLAVILCAATVIVKDPWSLAVVAVMIGAFYFTARLSFSDLWHDGRYLLVQMIVVFGLHVVRDGLAKGFWPGFRISLQIALFFIPGIVLLRTTQTSQMMRGLNRVVPYRLSFLVFTSLRFLPFFAREIREIIMAQRLRGAALAPRDLLKPWNWKDMFHCLMIPLLVRAMKTADEAALSAEARCFGQERERTYFDHLAWGKAGDNDEPEPVRQWKMRDEMKKESDIP